MEKMANNFAKYLASELKLDNDKKDIMAYGTFAILQTGISIFFAFIVGFLFNCQIETLIVSFTVSILRKYSGGAHASSPERCVILGTILCVGQAITAKYLIEPFANIYVVVFIGTIIFVWAYTAIYRLAPVDSPKKPIKTVKKRERMRKGSFVILGIYLFIIIINSILYLYTGLAFFIIYSLCIYIGVLWQVFTLTHIGHLLFTKIDIFLKNII